MAAFLLAYWRAGVAICVVALIATAGWRISAWRSAYKALPAIEARLKAERLCDTGSECAARVAALEASQARVTQEVVADYEEELIVLRNRPVPARVIRVCRQAGAGDVRRASAAAGTDGTGPAAGVISGADEFDTQPLRELARDADEVAARLRALQAWNTALSEHPREPRKQPDAD